MNKIEPLLLEKARVKWDFQVIIAVMKISPESYAFLLEHKYIAVSRWVLTGRFDGINKNLRPFLEANQNMIASWVQHNERTRKMLKSKKVSNQKPQIGYTEFCEQMELLLPILATQILGRDFDTVRKNEQ